MIKSRWVIAVLLCISSVIAWIVSYNRHLVTSYSDAMSHIDISRLVVDNIQPGLAQLGSVWLPLSQILYLPLVWNEWAWHSGFAGSFVSMISYILAAIGVYKITMELTARRSASLVALSAFALNPNLLYIQSTPLTEPLYVALLVASILFFIRYLKTHNAKYLVLAAVFTALQILTRYDGWFVGAVMFAALAYAELTLFHQRRKQVVGTLILFALPSVVAAGLWFLWNYLIFGSALYSFTGPYSAHAQQATIEAATGLITKHNIFISTKAFVLDIVANVGIVISILGTIGWLLFLRIGKRLSLRVRLLAAGLLAAVIAFNIIALFAGFSILNIPALHWNPAHQTAAAYFNVRYGVVALPFVAIGFGMLATRGKRVLAYILVVIVLLQAGFLLHQGLITVKDGTIGSSAFSNQDIATALKQHVGKSDKVIMSSSTYNGVMFESGLNLSQFIHEGVSSEWKDAIANPDRYAKWMVTANGDFGDPVYDSVVKQEKSAFLKYYKPVFSGHHANLYELRTDFERYVAVNGQQLSASGQNITIRGVNDYDLAYQTPDQIKTTFIDLQKAGVNAIRFWMYGDGIGDGFQPTVGGFNTTQITKTDYIFQLAHQYKIRLIPTLGNNYSDYGGAAQYLRWAGVDPADHDQFFTNPAIIQLYKNYVNHILTHQNPLTGTTYTNDSAVLAWDLLNEPRASNPGDIVAWENQIGSYVHRLDPNHLTTLSIDKPTMDAGLTQICASAAVSFCSIHIYPQEATIASYASLDQLQTAIVDYSKTAQALHKPIIVSEIGASKAGMPFGSQPLKVLSQTVEQLDKDHYSGWLIWNYSYKTDTSYGFSAADNSTYNLSDLQAIISK